MSYKTIAEAVIALAGMRALSEAPDLLKGLMIREGEDGKVVLWLDGRLAEVDSQPNWVEAVKTASVFATDLKVN